MGRSLFIRLPLPAARMMAARGRVPAPGSGWVRCALTLTGLPFGKKLARQDSNLECLDQNQVCYLLHHGPVRWEDSRF